MTWLLEISKILLEEQLLIKNYVKKHLIHSSFINKIWGADLTDMQLLYKFTKKNRFLLCVIDIYCKYT